MQSEERGRRFLQPAHRSRSEGPIGRDLDDDSFLVSEYKTQYAWVRRPPSARGPEAAPLLEVEKVMSSHLDGPTPRLGSTRRQNNVEQSRAWRGASLDYYSLGRKEVSLAADTCPGCLPRVPAVRALELRPSYHPSTFVVVSLYIAAILAMNSL